MRRLLACLMMLSVLLAPALALAETPIRLVVDGVEIQTDVAPVIEGGRTLVPLRAVTEALGFEVEWDGPSQTATLTKGGTTIMLTVDKPDALVNGELVTLDVAPTIRSDRMLVPVRFVAEQIGLDVAWDEETRMVVITSNEAATPTAVVDPEALNLLLQMQETGNHRASGDLTMTMVTVLGAAEMDMSAELYVGSEESLAYMTFRAEGYELTTGSAVYQGQFWSLDETGVWSSTPLEEYVAVDPLSNPTSLMNLNPEDLLGASVTLSQQTYEGTEMQVVTVSMDMAAFAELLGEQAEMFSEIRFEIMYWLNADNTPHHADLFVDMVGNDPVLLGATVQGSVFFEPWDQPIPFPAEITGADA